MKVPKAPARPLLEVGLRDLLADLEEPGCPVCRGAGRAAWRYIHSLLWEFVNDGEIRMRLRAAHGFCREHSLMALDVAQEQAAGLGMAILHDDFLRHVRGEAVLAARPKRGRRRRRQTRTEHERLDPHTKCRACESAERVAANHLRLLASSGAETVVGREARKQGRCICVPHLGVGLRLARGETEAANLLEVYLRGEAEMRRDLAEYMRKHDYRYASEPKGREADAWRRAVHLLVGAPVPRTRPERAWKRKTS